MKSAALQNRMRAAAIALTTVLTGASAVAQRTAGNAVQASDQLTAALVSRDTSLIKRLVDPAISYGHSNGWIETRDEMLRDLYNGTLRYNEIRLLDSPECKLSGNVAIIRHRIAIAIEMQGSKLEMNLAVMQVWLYHRGGWTLIGRQSCRIS
jgi:hypothetical protein